MKAKYIDCRVPLHTVQAIGELKSYGFSVPTAIRFGLRLLEGVPVSAPVPDEPCIYSLRTCLNARDLDRLKAVSGNQSEAMRTAIRTTLSFLKAHGV